MGRPAITTNIDKPKRFNTIFDPDTWANLRYLATTEGKSITGVIKEAIAWRVEYRRAVNRGAKLLIDRDGSLREISF